MIPTLLRAKRTKPVQLKLPGPSVPNAYGLPTCPSAVPTAPPPDCAPAKSPSERIRAIIRPKSIIGLTLRGIRFGLLLLVCIKHLWGIFRSPPPTIQHSREDVP